MAAEARRAALLMLGAILAALVVACGGESSPTDTGAADAGARKIGQVPAAIFDGIDTDEIKVYATTAGVISKAKFDSIYKTFTDLSGVEIVEEYNQDITKFLAAMEAGQGEWDAIELATPADWHRAREAGYLAKLDPEIVPLHLLEDGSSDEYGFRFERFGIVLAWNTEKIPSDGGQPKSLADVLNFEDFPGKRCMFNYPQYGGTLEAALLADGVAPEDLYPLDVDRALAKLDEVKDDIVWWSTSDEAERFLRSGECDLGIIWSGRVFDAVTKDDAPLDFTWKDALYTDSVWAIPASARNMKAAQALLATWILDREGQRKFVTEGQPYPTPIKGMRYPAETLKWMPWGKNLEMAIREDDEYYAKHIDELAERFSKWLAS